MEEENINLLDVEEAKKDVGGQTVRLSDGQSMEFTIGSIDGFWMERNGKRIRRYKYTGLAREQSELEFKEAVWFSGRKFFGQLVDEAEKMGIKSLKGVTMKVKRIGNGLNTTYVILDLIPSGESPQ